MLLTKLTTKKVENFLVCNERVPQQKNVFDCGVYVLQFAYLLHQRKEYKLLQDLYVFDIRSRIVNELYFQRLF